MPRPPDLDAPTSVLLGWMAAAVALPSVLLCAAVGQGLGAMAGGCEWIGISLPVGRQVWALVNQPTLDFAARSWAAGYWLGSLLLPFLVALAVLAAGTRPRTLTGGLVAAELAWGAAVGTAWLTLLDPRDGHLARWLGLHHLPSVLTWTVPLLAACAAAPATLRLLSLDRAVRPHLGRRRRLGLAAVYLLVPALGWAGLGWALAGRGSLHAAMAVLPPAVVALAVAFLFYPAPPGRSLRAGNGLGMAWLLSAAVVLGGLLWLAGRPVSSGRWAGVLWGSPNAFNNIRPWVVARRLPWGGKGESAGTGNREAPGGASTVSERAVRSADPGSSRSDPQTPSATAGQGRMEDHERHGDRRPQ